MIENQNITTGQNTMPSDPIDPAKIAAYMKHQLETAGKKFDEGQLSQIASRDDIKSYFREWHVLNGLKTVPTIQEVDMLWSGWETPSDIDSKKKTPSTPPAIVSSEINMESPSTSTDGAFSLAQDPAVAIDNDTPTLTPIPRSGDEMTNRGFIQNVIDNIQGDFFNMSESNAQTALQNSLVSYGYKIDQAKAGSNVIKIERPDGNIGEFTLFTPSYKAALVEANGQEEADRLEQIRFSELTDFIKGKDAGYQIYGGSESAIDSAANTLQQSSDLISSIAGIANSTYTPDRDHLNRLAGYIGADYNMFYNDQGLFDRKKYLNAIQKVQSKIKNKATKQKTDRSQAESRTIPSGVSWQDYRDDRAQNDPYGYTPYLPPPGDLLRMTPDGASGMLEVALEEPQVDDSEIYAKVYDDLSNDRKQFMLRSDNSSRFTGGALLASGRYKDIDLFSMRELDKLEESGLKITDLPTDGIKINGVASSYNSLQEIILDPGSRNSVITGDIAIEVDPNHQAYGAYSPHIKGALALIKRNNARKSKMPYAEIGYEWVEDLIQGVGIGGIEIIANLGKTFTNSLEGIGLSKSQAKSVAMIFGLPPEYQVETGDVQDIKSEYLPLFDSTVTDANSFGEYLTLVNEPFATTIPHWAAFSVNPTFGLSVTAVNAYGGKLNELEGLREGVKRDVMNGVELTPSQLEILKLDDWEARLISLTSATQETALTYAFTYNYFKGLAGAKNFKGVKNVENARKIAEQYTKSQRSMFGALGKFFGADPKAFMVEVPEETLIALNDYMIKVHFGIEEYDEEKRNKLLKDTALTTLFTSYGLGKVARYGQSRAAKSAADAAIKNYIQVNGQDILYRAKLESDAQIALMENQGLTDTPEYKEAKHNQRLINYDILTLDKGKKDLLSSFNATDKANFLELITEIEIAQAKVESKETRPGERRIASKNIGEIQAKMREILQRYPSRLSYEYLDPQKKQSYQDRASSELESEAQKKNKDYEVSSQEITERAKDLFLQDVVDGKQENISNFEPANAYGWTISPLESGVFNENMPYVTSVAPSTAEVKMKDGAMFNLQRSIDLARDITSQTILNIEPAPELSTETQMILGQLSQISRDGFSINDFSESAQKTLYKFFNDIKRNAPNKIVEPAYSEVQALIDGHNTALEMQALSNEQVTVFPDYSYSGTDLVEQSKSAGLMFSTFWQKNVLNNPDYGFATSDAFFKQFFRNADIRKPIETLWDRVTSGEAQATTINTEKIKPISNQFTNDVKAYNKANGTFIPTEVNESQHSMEQYMLAGAYRQSGIKDESGVDLEFQRWKKLLKQELDFRKKEYEDSKKNIKDRFIQESYKQNYIEFQRAYENIGFENATSYDQLGGMPFNKSFVENLAAAQSNEAALDRIRKYGGSLTMQDGTPGDPFVLGTYVPIPLTANLGKSNQETQYDGGSQESGKNRNAATLNIITFPESLHEADLRLNPGMFAENVYGRMRGAEVDIQTRDAMTAMKYAVEDPAFKNLFANPNEYTFFQRWFNNKQEEYNNIVTQGSSKRVEIGSRKALGVEWQRTTGKVKEAWYSTTAALALARPTQRISQFQSATFNVLNRLTSPEARKHMFRLNTLFYTGLSSSANGVASKTKIGKFIQESVLGRGDLQNIYNLSRTNLRNALAADLQVGKNQKVPISYYLNYLKVTDPKLSDEVLRQFASPSATIDQFFDFMSSGNELALDLFLASADRSAASASFESLYIEARIKQGEDLSGVNMTQWWANENKNPNQEAVNYADKIVGETQRQTGALSEAPIYTKGAKLNFGLQTLMPFGRFSSNAKNLFSTNVSVLNDPTVPPSQKEEARRANYGIMSEVATFQATKHIGNIMMIKGMTAGLLGFVLDEDDIARHGGYDQIIGASLGIEDRPEWSLFETEDRKKRYQDFLNSEADYSEKTTKEAVYLASRKLAEPSIDDASYFIYRFSKEYENKFQAGKTYDVIFSSLRDAINVANPAVLTNPGDNAMFAVINNILGKDVFTDFISQDVVESGKTMGNAEDAILEHALGAYGIGKKAVSDVMDAYNLYKENKYYTYTGDYGVQEQFVGPATRSQGATDKLDQAIVNLFYGRLMTVFTPGIPKAEANKYFNYLQRAIENEFKISKDSESDLPTDRSALRGRLGEYPVRIN